MKKGLILTNAFHTTANVTYQIKRFQEEFTNLGIEIDVKSNIVLPTLIDEGAIKSRLGHYDFILFLDKDRHISYMLEKAGYRLFNPAHSIELCDDKMLTYITLANQGLRLPKTISSPILYPNLDDHDFIPKVVQAIPFPIVVKECHGSLGKQVYKADNLEQLLVLREKLKYLPHLYQELIQTSYGRDVRVIVIGGKASAAMLRVSTTDFRSNIGMGGKGYPHILSSRYREVAEQIAAIMQLDYCGIDLLIGPDDEPIICEVNSNAFFEEIEKVSHVNIAKMYAEHIKKKVYGGQ